MKKIFFLFILIFFFIFFKNTYLYAEEKNFSLADCLVYALSNNPDIKSYYFKVKIYFSKTKQTESAYLPSLTVAAAYDRNKIQNNNSTDNYTDSLSLSQLLYDFNKTNYNIQMAYEALKQSEYNLYNKTQDVLIEIINAYYEVLKNIQLVKIKKSDLVRLDKTLDQIKNYFQLGLKAKIDFTTASVNLSEAKLELIKVENDLKVSYQNLYKAMGIKEDLSFNLTEIKETEKYIPSLAQAHEAGFKERRDLKILESQIKSALIGINYNQRGTYPALNANGSYNWNGKTYPLPYTWSIGLNFNWTFFDRGLTHWKVKEAEENVNDLKAQLESKKNELKKEIATYYSEMIKYFESIQINQEKLVLATENLELAEERYKVGVGNIVELTNAQSDYIKTEANAINSIYNYLKAKALLEKSTGIDLVSIYLKN